MTSAQGPNDTTALQRALAVHQAVLCRCRERKDVIAYLVKTVATEGEAMASLLHLVHIDGWSLERALAFQSQQKPRRSTAS